MEETLKERLERAHARISAACTRAGRPIGEVTLMGVTKTVPVETINQAIRLGIHCIGENKAQELTQKWDALMPEVDVHFIGHLQTNKVKDVVGRASLIHSVDSLPLAKEIDRRAEKLGIVQDILVQVNVDGDENKFGIPAADTEGFLNKLALFSHIRPLGLMTIPRKSANPEDSRLAYRSLRNLLVDIRGKNPHNKDMCILSMGMSGDFEVAVEEGATIVRIGSGIFGKRPAMQAV